MSQITQDPDNPNIFKYTDKCTYNFVEMEKYNESLWINSHYVDPDNCKMFIILLKFAFENMKSKGCTEFQQIVLESDWNEFLHENIEWNIIEKYKGNNNVPDTLLIKCNIDFANELIIDGFLRNNKTF